MIRKLAHLCLETRDLPRLVAFYHEQLGLPIKFTMTNKLGQVFGYYLECGDSTFIEIFDQAGRAVQWGGGTDELRRGNQFTHFSFEVTGLRDMVAALEAKGVKVGAISQGMDNSLQAWTADPDGNPVELMEYTSASKQIQR